MKKSKIVLMLERTMEKIETFTTNDTPHKGEKEELVNYEQGVTIPEGAAFH